MQPLHCALIAMMDKYMKDNKLKTDYFAEQIRKQQLIDIPEPCDRVRFDEADTVRAMENNGRHLRRWLSGSDYIPVRIVPTILRVMGLFPKVNLIDTDCIQHWSNGAKETLEVLDAFRKGIEDKSFDRVWQEGVEAIVAIYGMMLCSQQMIQEGQKQ